LASLLAIISKEANLKSVKESRMNVTINQRYIIIFLLAVIFVLALLKGLEQSKQIEELSSSKLQLADTQPVTIVSSPKPKQTGAKSNNLVLINSASAEEIAKNLEGIVKAIAKRIVTRRQKQGPHQNFEQLKAVYGVGEAKIEANRQRISFD
jgi:competence protein ComEA